MVPVRAFYALKHEGGAFPSSGVAIGLRFPWMQDCYAFDVGDFGKLGLLRHIHRVTGLRLGVLWWRTTLGTTGNDGKHVKYLQDPAFRACDPKLWDEMRRRFNPDARTIAALYPLLPAGTLFHDTPVPARARRSQWLNEAASSVRPNAVVFCDPDNGLSFNEPCRSLRHVGVEELRSLYRDGHSPLVYHTPDHSAPHAEQIASALGRLRQTIPDLGSSWAARFRRGSSRVFFVLAQRAHAAAIDNAMVQMQSSAWVKGGHFEIVPGTKSNSLPVSRTSPLETSTSTRPGRTVCVVLNDNGGLNVAANPWLTEIECPCHLTSRHLTFRVEAPFKGRTDMYRICPSALTLARALRFSGEHLSKRASVECEATVIIDAAVCVNRLRCDH